MKNQIGKFYRNTEREVNAMIAVFSLWNLEALAESVSKFISRYKLILLILPLILSGVLAIKAQNESDEKVLRDLIRREAAGEISLQYTENAVFANDSLPSPIYLKASDTPRIISDPRKNQILEVKIRRLVLSGTIAYEYSDFTLTYDQPDSTRDGYSGSILRVWRKTNGEWRIEAAFSRQNAPNTQSEEEKFLADYTAKAK